MSTENSIYDLYRLVIPVECATFINVYCRQPENTCKTTQLDLAHTLTQDEFLNEIAENDSPQCKVDCVILHPCYNITPPHKSEVTDIEINFDERFIKKLYFGLKPGGQVVIRGQIPFEFTLLGALKLCSQAFEWPRKPNRLRSFSGYTRILKAQGFKNIRSFNVVSGWDDPFSIVSTEYTASKHFFSTYVENHREIYSYIKYLFMKFLIKLNLIRYLEGNFLIVAQK